MKLVGTLEEVEKEPLDDDCLEDFEFEIDEEYFWEQAFYDSLVY
jgi:hypothetical protein